MASSLRRHIMMQQGGGGHNLPAEYQEVEWLESNRSQRIEIRENIDVLHSIITSETISEYLTNNPWFGYRSYFTFAQVNRSVFALWVNGSWTGNSIQDGDYAGLKKRVVLTSDNPNYSVTYEREGFATSKSWTQDVGGTAPSIYYLFTCGMYYNFDGKICYFKIETASKTWEFIPCYRKSDNEPGMYDIENGVFYTNAGTGTFVVGPDV